ncbi:hypothetical protein [Lactiplantibacillus fabifermentans]|uniref:Extracellular protein n=1 Tax=Lactiplantibacillus fabifermentans DSM 21115 TaxID=1413187 RepID=A0A0R2NRC0_9LACO|nr:hypothetical protein [Lactiplantibacillus fabifermentans]KRO28222.1 hypothetical protein DY78_GL002561 [Lactiplantibacillus fabifermentans DSM 21115]
MSFITRTIASGATLILGTTVIGIAMPAQAATHKTTTVPTSIQGTWYHYNKTYQRYDTVQATKTSFNTKSALATNWTKLSGTKFPSYALGHSELAVKKQAKGYYLIAKYATDGSPLWKKVTYSGHAALQAIRPATAESNGGPTTYYYQTKKIAKQPVVPFKVAKNDNFSSKKYAAVYVQADYKAPVKLYSSVKNAQKKRGKTITIKNITTAYQARWNDAKSDIVRVRVKNHTYYVRDTEDLQPSNSWRIGNTIYSPFAPTSTSKIVLDPGTKASKATKWAKIVHAGKNKTVYTTMWHRANGSWKK